MTAVSGGLLDSFQLALDPEGKSPKTLANYSRAVLAFAQRRAEHHLPDDVTTIHADMRGMAGQLARVRVPVDGVPQLQRAAAVSRLVRPRG